MPEASLSSQITTAYREEKANAELMAWLTRLKTWSLSAYQVIMSFRNFITQGQIFVYNVMSKNQKFSYQVNEDNFIKLLSGDLKVNRTNWDDVDAMGLASVLQLSVGDPQKSKLRLQKAKKEYRVNLSKDALYEFLYNNYSNALPTNRLYEMYSQIKGAFLWELTKQGSVAYGPNKQLFFSEKRAKEVKNYAEQYIQNESLAKDNIRFYKTGDAIQKFNSMTGEAETALIENKIGGSAGVSIRTISRGIRAIANLKNAKTSRSLIKRLKNLFTYSSTDDFARSIQEGAALEAEKAIKDIANSLVSGGYIKK